MSEFDRFAAAYPFALDDFQQRGCAAVEAGRGVLVAAPTGAGKTVVGEFAVHLALATGRKAFYTTPIKALSNQKYLDLVRRHGADRVGLLTGDSSVNGEAPVVVMTTEVLRNMMYAASPTLAGLGYVVMDEVHYLADRFRGAVWEEVIIHLPPEVVVVSLSATVSNAEEFGEWLSEVRGGVDVVVSEHRPVPLWQHVMVGRQLYDLFLDEQAPEPDAASAERNTVTRSDVAVGVRVNPELVQRIRAQERDTAYGHGGGHGGGHGRRGGERGADRGAHGRGGGARPRGPGRAEVVESLDRAALLPAIVFVFSRVGCDAAVGQLLARGVRLVLDDQALRIRRMVEERVAGLPDEDLGVLGYWDFVDGLTRGYAAHHAGMLPTFREIVEELFTAGLVRVVFATETLALGINMPARTVVLERLVKFNGETHAELTPAEYTQLTGRAGRRGIDVEGHAVVLWSQSLDPRAVAGLASTRTYPLRSSFRPTNNMAVNLVAQVGRARAREVLETSFAQFQADRAVVGLARSIRRNEASLAELAEQMHCHLGDFAEYAALRARQRDLEKESSRDRQEEARALAAASLERLAVGDVIRVPAGRRAGWAVVVATARRAGVLGPSVVTEDRQLRRLTLVDVPTPVEPVTRLRIAKSFTPKNPAARRDLAAALRAAVAHERPPRRAGRPTAGGGELEERLAEVRRELRAHPCHACPDREEHARWAQRWWRLRRETDALVQQVQGRTHTVARSFDRICGLLTSLGYLEADGERVAEPGETLRRLYTERDLLTAECLRRGVWRRLDPAGLAAVVSALVHEPRRDELDAAPRAPTDDVAAALTEMDAVWAQLEQAERAHGVPSSDPPDPGIAWMIHRWARGRRLEEVLRGGDLAAGDFVRRCKQVADLLGQIADLAPHPAMAGKARAAVDAVLRGVVAADRLD